VQGDRYQGGEISTYTGKPIPRLFLSQKAEKNLLSGCFAMYENLFLMKTPQRV
jgi:hypothetical protein